MTRDDQIADLLLLWEEQHDQGNDVSAGDLCRGYPELAEELQRQIDALKATAWVTREPPPDPPPHAQVAAPGTKPRTLEGRYRLDSPIAEGGFGRVWRGFDLELQRVVAVKVQKPSRVSSVEAFLGEARKLAQLHHPGIVQIHDVGHDGDTFLVTTLMEGGTLADRSRQGRLTHQEAARIVAEIADALGYAHRQGFVHRDLKPANILLDRDGRALLADFGIALTEEERKNTTSVGTLAYAAPEQLAGHSDVTSDIYSLGVVLYELLTGRLPYQGSGPAELREQILSQAPPAPRTIEPTVPKALERICLRCMARKSLDRYSLAAELAAELRGWLQRAGRSRR